jgi:hypothetical protein
MPVWSSSAETICLLRHQLLEQQEPKKVQQTNMAPS